MCAAIPTPAANPACQAIRDAAERTYNTPTHIYTSMTGGHTGGKPLNIEAIYINNMSYLGVSGKWRASPITAEMRQEARGVKESDPHFSCRQARDESVNGEPATLFTMHYHDGDATTDQQVWISKSRGLPLKQDIDMDFGASGKSHKTMRYEYTNVQAPAGVH
jgi:hypothetical protein